MSFTFGIITDGTKTDRVVEIIKSIYQQMIPTFEIIIVGGEKIEGDYINHIDFDTNEKIGWVTRQKNIITENAECRNIIFLHDYIKFLSNWYRGFMQFGDDWDICMNKIIRTDGSRFRDWVIWADKKFIDNPEYNGKPGVQSNIIDRILPPYTYTKTDNMYISGAYWVAKKYVMEECPLDESLAWGQGEDVEWTKRVLFDKKYRYKMNTNSTIQLMKPKSVEARDISTVFYKVR